MRDLVPLTARLGALTGVRGLLAGAAVVAAWAAPLAPGVRPTLMWVAAAYALLAAGLDGWRRAAGTLPLRLVGASLLVDGLYLVTAMALTGGPTGHLGFLAPAHLIAVTLLASYRTGLKIAMWQSLLLALAQDAHRSGLLAVPAVPQRTLTSAVMTLWLLTGVTAACSAFNERELRRGRAGSSALADMAERLQQLSAAEEVFPVLLDAVHRYTGYRRAAVLWTEDSRVVARSLDGEHATLAMVPLAPAGAIDRCWRARGPVLAAALDADQDQALIEVLPGGRNVVILPLLDDDGPLGVLAVERGGRSDRIPASVVTLLAQFAAHAALAYRNARLLEQVRRLAAMDGLTGLPNRRIFDDALTREVQRAGRTGQSLTLLLIDIDHFKAVNDTHGHQVGDEVLRHVGRVLPTLLRASDLPARYGGEEFVVLMPDCNASDALATAERLRGAIAASGAPVPVTASIGVATIPSDAADEAGLVEAADAALYRAKSAGRDRVMRATALVR